MMRMLALLVAFLSLAPLAPAADAPADKDSKALQGTWQAKTQRRGEESEAPERTQRHQLVIEGNKFKIVRDGQDHIKGTLKADPSAKPATIDFTITEAADSGDATGKVVLGIYELSGDELKWCSAQPGATDRPTGFDTSGTQYMLVTFTRAAKAAE
jgi:uncharacterized protein (TIGR03067 family)